MQLSAKVADNVYRYTVPANTVGVVFNNGSGKQTVDVNNPQHMHLYFGSSASSAKTPVDDKGEYDDPTMGVDGIENDGAEAQAVYYNMQGARVDNPGAGLYIVVRGAKVTKEYVR